MARCKIKKWALNIDKLRVCFNLPDDVYTNLSDSYTKQVTEIINGKEVTIRILSEDYFSLVFYDEDETTMLASLNISDGDGSQFKLGTFQFNIGKKYKNKAFFTFENDALYRIFTKGFDGEPINYISCVLYVAEYYGMEFNNLTEVELAFDSDFNFVQKIRKMIRDVDKYDLYLNGKKVTDDEILKGYGEYYSRNRLKLQLPTLYFSQAKGSDMQMRVYDKGRELRESTPYKKERYKEWNNWDDVDNVHRVEVVMHNSNVRDFFERNSRILDAEVNQHDNILNLLCMLKFRMMMFLDAIDRIIYFKDRKTDQKITLLEIDEI